MSALGKVEMSAFAGDNAMVRLSRGDGHEPTGTITMRMREFDRIKIIQAVVDGDLKPGAGCGTAWINGTSGTTAGAPLS
jgi:hypothetical protein